jgi:glycosyltransferase involved in cell wall biosynthesis
MRIAFVVTGGLDRSGRDRVVPALLALVERVARHHDVVAYVLRYYDQPCRYDLAGATIRDLGRPQGIRRQCSTLLGAMRRDGPFDLVHAYWALPAGLTATVVATVLRIPSIVTLDSGEFVGIPDIAYGLQLRWRPRLAVWTTSRLATHLTVCGRYQERLALARGYRPDVIPLGVDTSLFQPAARTEGPPWRLIHVASLNPVKDQPTLVDAMRRLLTRVPDVHLDLVGEDTLNGAIQAAVERAAIARRVTFHGVLRSDELVPLYQRAHLQVLSSRHEAAGVVVLEAAACGVPTVGTSVGYVADWALDKAVAVRPGDPAALADAIERTLADPQLRDRLAARARAWTLEHDADWTAGEFERLYHATAD